MTIRSSRHTLSFARSMCAASLLAFASGCAITVHQSSTPASETGNSGGKSKDDKPKDSKPKDDKPKDSKPKEEKPKDSKPKDDKPVIEKPKDDKPVIDKPVIEKPKDDKPVVDKPKETPKPTTPVVRSDTSEFVVPVRVPLEVVNARIDALLPKTESQDWKRATKKDASPEIDVKYRVWRDPVQTSLKGSTLRVTVPVRYAANVRAKVKNPIGGKWVQLTQNETWGTAGKPQRLSIVVDLTLSVENNWKVKSVSKLVELKHGAPPKENVCVKVGIDVCVPKSTLTDRVREEIDKELVPKIEKQLAKADGEIEKALDLKKHANTLWLAIQEPQRIQKGKQESCPTAIEALCSEDAWVQLQLQTLGVSPIGLDEDDLSVSLAFTGKATTSLGKKPTGKNTKLPSPTAPKTKSAIVVRSFLELPKEVLDESLAQALAGKNLTFGSKKLDLGKVTIGLTPNNKTVSLSIEAKGLSDKLEIIGALELDEKSQTLRLGSVDLSSATRSLLQAELPGFDEKALENALRDAIRFSYKAGPATLRQAVEKALGGFIPGKLNVRGGLTGFEARDFNVTQTKISIGADIYGNVEIEYEP